VAVLRPGDGDRGAHDDGDAADLGVADDEQVAGCPVGGVDRRDRQRPEA
jgi:hypothetical protein